MDLNAEINSFDLEITHLLEAINIVAPSKDRETSQYDLFVCEAIIFRLFRISEKLIRASFLNYCIVEHTDSNKSVRSKLKCRDWDTAEEILKAGNKFLGWGSISSVTNLANLVFDNGFPIVDLLSPMQSDLIDLQRFRNFIAHDSKEARIGFCKARKNYTKPEIFLPETVGELALYRRNISSDVTIRTIHNKISVMSRILREL